MDARFRLAVHKETKTEMKQTKSNRMRMQRGPGKRLTADALPCPEPLLLDLLIVIGLDLVHDGAQFFKCALVLGASLAPAITKVVSVSGI